MFFCLPYQYPPAGLYSWGHFLLLILTALAIAVGLYASRNMSKAKVRRTIRYCTALLILLEAAKIVFVLLITGSRNPNDFVPLYYCSLVLYAGLCSSLAHGLICRIGDCFLATGGLIGGLCFLFCPNTSLPRYPLFHFISLHSFLLHGLMVYLALLLLMRGVYRIRFADIGKCAAPVSLICLTAFFFNRIYDKCVAAPVANLMFLSKDFPGTPVSILYHLTRDFFPLAMWAVQAFVPFIAVWLCLRLVRLACRKKRGRDEI